MSDEQGPHPLTDRATIVLPEVGPDGCVVGRITVELAPDGSLHNPVRVWKYVSNPVNSGRVTL